MPSSYGWSLTLPYCDYEPERDTFVLKKATLTLANMIARRVGANLCIPYVARTSRHSSMPLWDERVRHAKKLGFTVTSCLDVGAFVGTWTKSIIDIFPGCEVIAIEPNPHIQAELTRNLSALSPPPRILQMAVAEKNGQMNFNIWGDPLRATSASLQDHVMGDAENKVTVEVDTLDNIVAKYDLAPELVKLDLQGAEIRALRGATSLLTSAEMFIVEFGCLNAYVDRATPRQLFDIFYDNDYCLYDIVECHYRPYDGALTGGDFIFVKNNSQLRSYRSWA